MTEKQKQTVGKVADATYPEEKVCYYCGAPFGLHNYDTFQCPKNGRKSDWDKKQEWQNTFYSIQDNAGKRQAFLYGSEHIITNPHDFGLVTKEEMLEFAYYYLEDFVLDKYNRRKTIDQIYEQYKNKP